MSQFDEQHLIDFKRQSDQAFAAMLERADREMASFMRKYGGPESPASAVTKKPTPRVYVAPSHSPGTYQEPPRSEPEPDSRSRRAMAMGEELYEKVTGDGFPEFDGAHLADSKKDLTDDFNESMRLAKEQARATAEQATQGTASILKNSTFDLGARAKREAAALKEAAKKALEEERSLKGLRGRAKAEMEKAKNRLKEQMQEVKADTIDDLRGLAAENLGDISNSANALFEQSSQSVQRELGDVVSGKDS